MTTYLEKAAEALSRQNGCKAMCDYECDCRRDARIVAEALYPETPEPKRLREMSSALFHAWMEDGADNNELQARIAYTAERKLVLGL